MKFNSKSSGRSTTLTPRSVAVKSSAKLHLRFWFNVDGSHFTHRLRCIRVDRVHTSVRRPSPRSPRRGNISRPCTTACDSLPVYRHRWTQSGMDHIYQNKRQLKKPLCKLRFLSSWSRHLGSIKIRDLLRDSFFGVNSSHNCSLLLNLMIIAVAVA